MRRFRLLFLLVGVAGLLLASCGDDDDADVGTGGDLPTVVVTTSILGDVVENVAGGQVEVVTIMPVGADPHEFQASAQQANEMREADALVVNGASFEEGLLDVIDAATDDGVPTFGAISAVETIEFGEDGHAHEEGEEHSDEEHSDEEHADEDHEHSDEEHSDEHDEDHADEEASGTLTAFGGEDHSDEDHADEGDHDHDHDHSGDDPHFFTDPARMAESADAMADFLIENVEGVDADALRSAADEYVAELEAVDSASDEMLAAVPDDQRILVTDHDVFGYFADRYDFEVVGTVIPSGSTADGASAGELAELAETVEAEGVPAIFVGTTVSDDLSQTLAAEAGSEVEVIEVYTGSLGEEGSDADTYIGYVETNAERIAEGLRA